MNNFQQKRQNSRFKNSYVAFKGGSDISRTTNKHRRKRGHKYIYLVLINSSKIM